MLWQLFSTIMQYDDNDKMVDMCGTLDLHSLWVSRVYSNCSSRGIIDHNIAVVIIKYS